MEGRGSGGSARDRDSSPPLTKASKFSVYQNASFSAALIATSLQPSSSALLRLSYLSSASAIALLAIFAKENGFITNLKLKNFSEETANLLIKVIEISVGFVFVGATFALFRTMWLRRSKNSNGVPAFSPFKETKDQVRLTDRQLGLLGIKPKVEQILSDSAKKPPKSKPSSACSPSEVLVPLHQSIIGSNRSSRNSADRLNSTRGNRMFPVNSSPSKTPGSSSSLYLVPGSASPLSSSPAMDSVVSSPWSSKRVSSKEITSEEKLEQFLSEVDERITESAGKLATPPPTIRSFDVASPNTISGSANTSGNSRSTPLRPVRMSPSSQKFTTPPKKGESELPSPMSMEESIAAFEHLGIYPQIEQWRDSLRQWFSSVLLNPLLNKIETSHIQVMQSAAKLGISISISQVGSELPSNGTVTASSMDRNKEWQPTVSLDEDGLVHQLRATLLQALDASKPKMGQQSQQPNPMVPLMQECVDAISEHQKLQALMKGEWVKGLLPQTSIRADYTVRRIRELAEGTCLKNYEYLGNGDAYDTKTKKWTVEIPTDSHLLLYLLCAFLEHPKWMLHVDPTSYVGSQSSKNPLFLGVLPPKERFPEKYIAIVTGVPSVLHPGACVLALGRQSPPIFALYWDKKSQFSLQGRTALWDSVLLLSHRIRTSYGGIVRGLHLGSSAINILSVLDPESKD